MSANYVFRCRMCHQVIGKPYISLDRRTERWSMGLHDGKVMPVVTVTAAQELFRYDSPDCRKIHEPQVIAELQIKTTYPDSSGSVVPCSRCGSSVDRSLPHVSYGYLETELDAQGMVVTVIDETELAVLCRDCEEPDGPQDEAAAVASDQQERTRA